MPTSSLRVGVDLVRVADVTSTIARFGTRYTGRIFTAGERAYCDADETRAAERFAARFAAKEATLKVLRPSPLDGVDWRSIEIRQLGEGACDVILHDAALTLAQRERVTELSLSMSHEHEYATATVVARLEGPPVGERHPRVVRRSRRGSGGPRQAQTSWDA